MATKTKPKKSIDFKVFTRLMSFAKRYRVQFWVATVSTITLAFFAAASPVVLMRAIDDFTETKNSTTSVSYTHLTLPTIA